MVSDAFVSYSHRDRDFAVRLQRALNASEKDVWVDERIEAGSQWADDLRDAIENADAFVFVISPDSVESSECKKELLYAAELNKRIIPVNLRTTPLDVLPEQVRAIQFVPPRGLFEDNPEVEPEIGFNQSLTLLIKAIDTDHHAVHEHTELGKKALEWERHGRDRSFLLSGSALETAERWLARGSGNSPDPTELQGAYILASRQGTSRRQRRLLGGVSVALVVTLIAGLVALNQRSEAEAQANVARARALSAEAATAQRTQPALSMLLAVEASRLSNTAQTQSGLFESVYDSPHLARIGQDFGQNLSDFELSPDGKAAAVGYADGSFRLWDFQTERPLTKRIRIDRHTVGVTWASDNTLATYWTDGEIRLWDRTTGHELPARFENVQPIDQFGRHTALRLVQTDA